MREYFRDDNAVQVLGPMPEDIHAAVAAVEVAEGIATLGGEFAPGLPYALVRDPDGYQIEVGFE